MKIYHSILLILLLSSGKVYGHERLNITDLIEERTGLETSLRRHFIDLVKALIEKFNIFKLNNYLLEIAQADPILFE